MLLQAYLPWNKMKPIDAVTSLSYVVTNGFYGLICGTAIAKLGDDSLFDVEPTNDYISPTLRTSEEVDQGFRRYPEINTTIETTLH